MYETARYSMMQRLWWPWVLYICSVPKTKTETINLSEIKLGKLKNISDYEHCKCHILWAWWPQDWSKKPDFMDHAERGVWGGASSWFKCNKFNCTFVLELRFIANMLCRILRSRLDCGFLIFSLTTIKLTFLWPPSVCIQHNTCNIWMKCYNKCVYDTERNLILVSGIPLPVYHPVSQKINFRLCLPCLRCHLHVQNCSF